MYRNKKYFIIVLICTFMVLVAVSLFDFKPSQAQYWAAMPPYNILWPLWSPALSPPVTPLLALPTPLVNFPEYTLSVKPGKGWDPCQPNVEFDGIYGLNPWPPPYLTDPMVGSQAPITLPIEWSN